MHNKPETQSTAPFKAKLRHYHRTASPSLYSRKQKRWEDASASELGDASVSDHHGDIDLAERLASDPKKSQK